MVFQRRLGFAVNELQELFVGVVIGQVDAVERADAAPDVEQKLEDDVLAARVRELAIVVE